MALLRAGLLRSVWRNVAGMLVTLIAAGALFSALALFAGMQRTLEASLRELNAEIILTPKGQAAVAGQLLSTGSAPPLEPSIPVTEWRQRLSDRGVVGVAAVEGLDLSQGGAGVTTDTMASILLVRLEEWVTPTLAVPEVTTTLPEADVVAAEQTARQVARQLNPILRYLSIGASVALLAAVLMTGLLTSVRVAERRAELGMMRAMGASRWFLMRLTLAESGALAAAGAVVGVLVGLLLVALLPGSALRQMRAVEWLQYGGGSVLVTVAVAELATVAPAVRAGRMDPLEAARRGR